MLDLVVYGSPASPFVRKVETVLQEKALAYDFENVNIMDLPDWFKEISPLRRIPVFRDRRAGAEGVPGTIPDSSAICGYLERLAPEPALIPDDPYAAGRVLWYEEYADSEMATVIGAGIFRPIMFPRFSGKESDIATAKTTFNEKLPPICDYLETSLAGNRYFVGASLTLADVAIASQLSQMDLIIGTVDESRWPGLARHYQELGQLQGMAANLAVCTKMFQRVLPEKINLS